MAVIQPHSRTVERLAVLHLGADAVISFVSVRAGKTESMRTRTMERRGGEAAGRGGGRSVLGASYFGIKKSFQAWTSVLHLGLNSCYGCSGSWQQSLGSLVNFLQYFERCSSLDLKLKGHLYFPNIHIITNWLIGCAVPDVHHEKLPL